MEVRSTQSFNAIPATLIRGVFNLYLNLLLKYIVNTLFIYSIYLSFFLTIVIFSFYLWQIYTYLLIFALETLFICVPKDLLKTKK